jgi:hypothetical protein
MLSIPIDVLRLILEHVDKATLVTMCKLNKVCCSCSQDVLYRDIQVDHLPERTHVCQTLAQSTDLARRVRLFEITSYGSVNWKERELRNSLQNMTCLRILRFYSYINFSVLEGCTFNLVSFACDFFYPEPLRQFLHSQPSLTHVSLGESCGGIPDFDATHLPNLTRIGAHISWLPRLIPNRPVNEVVVHGYMDDAKPVDLSFFTLSTTPIQRLAIKDLYLYPKPIQLLESMFPSITHLKLDRSTSYSHKYKGMVRERPFLFISYLTGLS